MYSKSFFTCTLYFITISATFARVSYNGYSLLRVTPSNEEQLNYLLKINSNSSIGIDFWLRTTAVNNSADVMVSPKARDPFVKDLEQGNISYTIMIQDIGKTIKDDLLLPVPEVQKGDFFCRYRSYVEIIQFLLLLTERNSDVVSTQTIGSTFEGRPLILTRISKPDGKRKPALWIQGGAHAREHIGIATVVYLAMQVVSNIKANTEDARLLGAFDWFILPVLNPDGYEYSLNSDRLWRKTRSFTGESRDCMGVDANRNWDYHWNDAAGSSRDPCSHNYAGPKAFSEPETRSVADFMLRELKGRLLLFLDIHSYSQRWLTPWGYTSKLPENYKAQEALAKSATSALERIYGTKYSVGSSGSILYTVSGGARDWVFGVVKADFSYVVELRDRGDYGFVLPKAQIRPTVIETWAGVQEMIRVLAVNHSASNLDRGDLQSEPSAPEITLYWMS